MERSEDAPPISRRGFIALTGVATVPATGEAADVTKATSAGKAQHTRREIKPVVNGRSMAVELEPRVTLLDFLRDRAGLTGTKKGCNEGACGTCTVLVDGKRMNACLTLAVQCAGRHVTTIEGIGGDGQLHVMQQAFIRHDALQCGYCTPGQIISAIACIAEGHAGSEEEVREWMSGNICRCAAYPQITAAVLDVASQGAELMRDFDYVVAKDIQDAFASDGVETMPIAGGTELLNWFRLGIASPSRLVDLGQLRGLDGITRRGDRLFVGALATLNTVGEHPLVRAHAAVLGEACLKAASAQVRNRATVGGNILQKTRCAYFRAEAPLPWGCNKRNPGSGCAAREGLNERHAIFGWTDACVAVQPSDPLTALVSLDAEVELRSRAGSRVIKVAELHLSQEEAESTARRARRAARDGAATIETQLRTGELIGGYRIPVRSSQRSAYVKVRERASYEYALVSAAATLSLSQGRISQVAVVLGSVAQRPWRLNAVERLLVGQPPTRDAVLPILQAAFGDARPLAHNRYKVSMAAGAAARAIVEAGAKA